MKFFIVLIRFSIIVFSILGCLQQRETVKEVSASSSWFEGITTVKNLGGNPSSIKLSWNPSDKPVIGYKVYALVYNNETKANEWTIIDELGSEQLSYIHSELSSGQVYSYMIRAVDSNSVEDTNSKQLSTVAFEGIGSVKITGSTTASVFLNTGTGAFDEVRVYAQPVKTGSARVLVKSIKGNVSQIDLSNLHSGVKYKFFVNAYMSYLSAEDGNEIYYEGKTASESFGSGVSTDTNFSYRGVMAVQAYGDAPNASVAPKSRMIKLVWPAFVGATSASKYKLVRTSINNIPDVTTELACTASVQQSCVVSCSNVGAGTQTCDDTNISAPPMTYNYVITQVKKDSRTLEEWTEELPATNASDFYIKVPVPSNYMVLVQRDAANYEMCQLLGQNANPRKFQRCTYTGIGASPFNSGPGKSALNLESGFYDFGYNLFIDRFKLACNWTRNSSACGPDGCIGKTGTVGAAGPPASGLGNVGDIYFALNTNWGPNCYYKTASGWVSTTSLTASSDFAAVGTVDPGVDGKKHNPPITSINQAAAYNLCSNKSSDYGPKRLMRRREYVHAAAFPKMPGEPNYMDTTSEYNLREGIYSISLNLGGQLPGFSRCDNSSEASRLLAPTTLSDLLAVTNTRTQLNDGSYPILNTMSYGYFIGTTSTSNCVSRWGAQDPIGIDIYDRHHTIFSDTFLRTNSMATFPPTFAPVASDYDSGVGYDWGNYQFDGTTSGPAIGASGDTYKSFALGITNMSMFPKFILPMGVPLVNTVYGSYKNTSDLIYNGALGANAFNGSQNAVITVTFNGSATKYIMNDGYKHRFSYTIRQDGAHGSNNVWCVVEAE